MTIKLQLTDKKWLQEYDDAYYKLLHEQDEDDAYIKGYAFGQLLGYTSSLLSVYQNKELVAALSLFKDYDLVKEVFYEYENIRNALSQDESYQDKTSLEIEGIAKGMLESKLRTINNVYLFMDNYAIHQYFHYNIRFIREVTHALREYRDKLIREGTTFKKHE